MLATMPLCLISCLLDQKSTNIHLQSGSNNDGTCEYSQMKEHVVFIRYKRLPASEKLQQRSTRKTLLKDLYPNWTGTSLGGCPLFPARIKCQCILKQDRNVDLSSGPEFTASNLGCSAAVMRICRVICSLSQGISSIFRWNTRRSSSVHSENPTAL